MSKKYIFVWMLNMAAFGSIMELIYSKCGGEMFFRVLIPAAIILGTLFGFLGVLLKNKDNGV